MSKAFDSIMQGFKEFAKATNNSHLLNEIQKIQSKTEKYANKKGKNNETCKKKET